MSYNNRMLILFEILAFVTFILMLLVASSQPVHSRISVFELERRAKLGNKEAKKDLERERLLGGVSSIKNIALVILQILSFSFFELGFGMLVGIISAFVIAFGCESMSHWNFFRHISRKIYGLIEPSMLNFIRKNPLLFRIIGGASGKSDYYDLRIDSREELQHLVTASDSVLTPDEKQLIVHSLTFSDRLVSTVMTPSHMIVTINKSEFLGPLMLSDLHKVGHNNLPVIDGDLNHIIGMLNLKNLMKLDNKKSMTAEKVMDPKIYYIREDQTLHHALVAFLHTHHHLLIVVNEAKETVGILALEDIIESLLGRKIDDEFDEYDDIRAVASRKK